MENEPGLNQLAGGYSENKAQLSIAARLFGWEKEGVYSVLRRVTVYKPLSKWVNSLSSCISLCWHPDCILLMLMVFFCWCSFLDVGLPLWIGGVPFNFPSTAPHQPSSVGFAGCIRNVTINDRLLDLEGYIEQQNSTRGCGQIADSCASSMRQCGSGTCVPELGGSSCICPPQSAGDNCEKGT